MSQTNIRLLIAYDGSNYCGWQRQKNGPTIQGTIEEKIEIITGCKSTVNGAGRTDAGVHALAMAANFQTSATIPASAYTGALNSMLPKDIRILQSAAVSADFHARYNSTGKTYRYDFFTGSIQPPYERLYRTHSPQPFDLGAVRDCLQQLVGTHDFTSFEAAGSRDLSWVGGRGAVRTLINAECTVNPAEPEYFSFTFTGDGFLRHMVRNIAGTLFPVGSGRISRDEFAALFAAKNRQQAGPTAPACGLFLKTVHYDPFPESTS